MIESFSKIKHTIIKILDCIQDGGQHSENQDKSSFA